MKASKRPNVIVILTDDQGCWAMGCAGNPEIRTPNLDRLAATGMRFENFFCASPVCSPARASLLTGRIPSQHGVHDWLRAGNTTIEPERGGALIEYLKGQTAYTDMLAAAGYVCGLSGKWHLGNAHDVQKSFSFWKVHAMGGGPYYNAPMIRDREVYEEPRYVTDVITDNALEFLQQRAGAESPFYLSVHYTAPHSPWTREHHPAEIYDGYYHDCPFESVPEDLVPPDWVRQLGIPEGPEMRRTYLSGYCAAVTVMDANVGRLLDWVESNGLREDTLVLFTSDNGMNMGHHGVFGKGNATFPLNMLEESVKVPFLASMPGRVPEAVTCRELLSHYDVMPTLLDCVGACMPTGRDLPGRSFAGLLRGESASGRERVVVFDEYGPVRMIRERAWKYVHRYPYGPHELFNLEDDPRETVNRVDSPDCGEKLEQLRAQLDDWFLRYVDPAFDGAREAVTGEGQLGLAGPAAKGQQSFQPLEPAS